jgi:phosphate starvation-inducible membrane PsiE
MDAKNRRLWNQNTPLYLIIKLTFSAEIAHKYNCSLLVQLLIKCRVYLSFTSLVITYLHSCSHVMLKECH